ncbi:MAG: hypothetical protein PHT48_04325 [Dechloromonas sp.]|nr:hypothetical protein [Dechloromonas sp.]
MAATCELLLHGLRQQQAANPEALSWVCGRLIGALAHLFKWQQLHYGPIAPELWLRAGQALMLAEQHDVGEAAGRADEARQEYARLMALQAASLNSLTPAQMDTAEMLIDHFVDGFALSSQPVAGAVYWIDPAGAMPAQRVSQAAELPLGRVRYMLPGQAHSAMADLLTQLDAGQAVPQELKRRGALAHTIRAVLPHLLDQFSALPLPRAHVRRAVRQRMAVLHGLPAAWQAFAWRKAGMAGGQSGESWVVEDASAGGFRASLIWHGADWLKIGALLSLCPEGGDNWLLGCIRRCQRDPDGSAYIGIEVLGRQVQAVDFRLRPVVAGSYARAEVVPGLLILDAQDDDACRVILPAGAFALKESLGCLLGDVNYVLTPVCLLEQGGGFALACYSSPELRSRSMGGS